MLNVTNSVVLKTFVTQGFMLLFKLNVGLHLFSLVTLYVCSLVS